ncbi:MAG: hypothetical protein EB084_17990 [Proteobacteria bacterium]|nr:hypothetical protein [Pseudomonadota bacterium]
MLATLRHLTTLAMCASLLLLTAGAARGEVGSGGTERASAAAVDDGLIVGIAHIDRPDQTQVDATRNIRVYTYLVNTSKTPRVIDWRTRRLRSPKLSALISDSEKYGLFVMAPGEIVLMKSFFYYKTGAPGAFTFSVRDREQRVYSVPAKVKLTSHGPFDELPEELRSRLIQTFLANQAQGFRWWYPQY